MSEKEATEEQIQETLDKIILENPDHTIRFLAKILFNVRFDLDEFKIEIIKFMKNIPVEEDELEVEIVMPDKVMDNEVKRFYNDFYT